MTILKRLALTLLLAGATANAWAAAKTAACSSECLLDLVNHYLDAMIAHDASALPFAPGLKATENGKVIQPGEGMWKTAQAFLYRHTVADPSAGQAAFFGVVKEEEGQALLVIRLAVADGKITEAETMVARKGAHPNSNPDRLRTVAGIWTSPVPQEDRLSRTRLMEIADSYFEGLEKHSAEAVPFHPDCNRTENGTRTTNTDPEPNWSSCSKGFKEMTAIKKVRERRYPVVDEKRGLVLSISVFDIVPDLPNSVTGSNDPPLSMLLYELFKIDDGRIREIEGFMRDEPPGFSNGWGK